MNLKLRHEAYCDGCEQLKKLGTIGGHTRCDIYKRVMIPDDQLHLVNKGLGYFQRPDICKEQNETEIVK